jgi:uncharacterized protein YndB with AHSA1/START domain
MPARFGSSECSTRRANSCSTPGPDPSSCRFHWCINNPSFGDCWCVGVYREVVRPERIVYTLATADSAGSQVEPAQAGHDPRWPRETLVIVTFAEVHGRTRLTLEQNALEWLAKETGAHPSWLQMLDRLHELVATRKASNA